MPRTKRASTRLPIVRPQSNSRSIDLVAELAQQRGGDRLDGAELLGVGRHAEPGGSAVETAIRSRPAAVAAASVSDGPPSRHASMKRAASSTVRVSGP